MSRRTFPPGFLWGTATSAFQIEGAVDEDGRGVSIWDRFASLPGRIEDGGTGQPACDHYHRFEEDIRRMAELGLGAYRFSVAWPRVVPTGAGAVNAAGLDFYDRLVDALLEQGIRPLATLYHWDLPQALEERGGWRQRDTALAFCDYAAAVARRLGDRVGSWVTHNEPWCVAALGHEQGHHAPGLKDPSAALVVAHHLLLSHGMSIPVLRAESPGCEVGLSSLIIPGHPASDSDADQRAAALHDALINRWYVEPVQLGGYPVEAVEHWVREGVLHDRHPVLARPEDLVTISAPTDFLGINYYSRAIVRCPHTPDNDNAPRTRFEPPADEKTDMGWEVYPHGLFEVLTRAHRDWATQKIYLTEFGAAYGDGPGSDGRVRDDRRIRYLRAHLEAVLDALESGVPVAGAFVWSLLDNFEWSFGYTKRFGLVWIDFESQDRVIKESGRWYATVAQRNALEDDV